MALRIPRDALGFWGSDGAQVPEKPKIRQKGAECGPGGGGNRRVDANVPL